MTGRLMALEGVHFLVLIPGTCEYVTWQVGIEVADGIHIAKYVALRQRDSSGLSR